MDIKAYKNQLTILSVEAQYVKKYNDQAQVLAAVYQAILRKDNTVNVADVTKWLGHKADNMNVAEVLKSLKKAKLVGKKGFLMFNVSYDLPSADMWNHQDQLDVLNQFVVDVM